VQNLSRRTGLSVRWPEGNLGLWGIKQKHNIHMKIETKLITKEGLENA